VLDLVGYKSSFKFKRKTFVSGGALVNNTRCCFLECQVYISGLRLSRFRLVVTGLQGFAAVVCAG
jgi:hypothetical protein